MGGDTVKPDPHGRGKPAALDDADRLHQLVAEAAATPLPGEAGLSAERAEELISEIRAARDVR